MIGIRSIFKMLLVILEFFCSNAVHAAIKKVYAQLLVFDFCTIKLLNKTHPVQNFEQQQLNVLVCKKGYIQPKNLKALSNMYFSTIAAA